MFKALTLDPQEGFLRIEGCSLVVSPELTLSQAKVQARLELHSQPTKASAWFSLPDLHFGGQPAFLGLCFRGEQLELISLGVVPPGCENLPREPNQDAFDAEIAFLQAELGRQLGCSLLSGQATFPWGAVWAKADYKTGFPSAGLRYKK